MTFKASATILACVILTACASSSSSIPPGASNNGTTSRASFTAATDASALVDACVRFMTTGAESSLSELGYQPAFMAGGTAYAKSVPYQFTLGSPGIVQIRLKFSNKPRGDRLCEIDHIGATRGSGTGRLVAQFIERMEVQGWVLSGRDTLTKGERSIEVDAKLRRSTGSSSSELNFRG